MLWSRIVSALLLVALPGLVGPRVAVAAPVSLSVTVAAPVEAVLSSSGKSETLYITTTVTYSGPDVLQLHLGDFALVDADGRTHGPDSYDGPNALPPAELAGPSGRVLGLLVFTLHTNKAKNLSLLYKQKVQTPDGMTHTGIVARAPVPAPEISTWRQYATSAQPWLRAYLLDEALVAGYIRVVLAPLYAGGDVTLAGAARSRLQAGQQQLAGDRAAFDAVKAPGREAQKLERSADGTFRALDRDLVAALARRGRGEWLASFMDHDRALARLYQTWPAMP